MNILFFSFLAAGATILGGSIPLLHKKLSDKQLTLLVAFSAGILLSTGLNHMVAESFAEAGRWGMLSVSIGFVVLYGYEKMAMVHACREQDCHVHHFGGSALVGMGFHSFLDGFAIAVSFEFEKTLGVLVIVAVMLHRLPTGISMAIIMLSNKYNESKAWITLTIIPEALSSISPRATFFLWPMKTVRIIGCQSLSSLDFWVFSPQAS